MQSYRQGDVYLIATDKLPDTAAPVQADAGRVVLAYGEVTGHAHAIQARPDVVLLTVPGETDRWLRIGGDGAELRHEEHATISLPPGLYRVRRQREYAPERPRYVAD